jgi:hypothetical protein
MRDPTGNAFWSLVIPGVGQFMNDDWGKGVLMMSLNVLNNARLSPDSTTEELNSWVLVGAAIGVWSAVDAYQVASELNATRPLGTMPAARAQARTPMVVLLDPVNECATASFEWRF